MSAGTRHSVLTIGHSTHSSDEFAALLRHHDVTAVVDVRSAPFSRFNPQFNKEAVENNLRMLGIHYLFLGRELGARPNDPSCYENGRIQFARLSSTHMFRTGIERILRGSIDFRIALMCAEKEPLDCHRTVLVSRVLAGHGVAIEHILADGRLEPHDATMERLLALLGLPHRELFRSHDELIAEALAQQEERIAYVDETLASETAKETS